MPFVECNLQETAKLIMWGTLVRLCRQHETISSRKCEAPPSLSKSTISFPRNLKLAVESDFYFEKPMVGQANDCLERVPQGIFPLLTSFPLHSLP